MHEAVTQVKELEAVRKSAVRSGPWVNLSPPVGGLPSDYTQFLPCRPGFSSKRLLLEAFNCSLDIPFLHCGCISSHVDA